LPILREFIDEERLHFLQHIYRRTHLGEEASHLALDILDAHTLQVTAKEKSTKIILVHDILDAHDLAFLRVHGISSFKLDHLALSETRRRDTRRVHREGEFGQRGKTARELKVRVMAAVVCDAGEPVELWEDELRDVVVDVRKMVGYEDVACIVKIGGGRHDECQGAHMREHDCVPFIRVERVGLDAVEKCRAVRVWVGKFALSGDEDVGRPLDGGLVVCLLD
jgi:hypothetical protein